MKAAKITPADFEANRLFWRYWGSSLFNAMLNAKGRLMIRYPGMGYKRMDQQVLHVYTECPEGKLIAIAKRDAVSMNSPEQMKGLEWCGWCQAKDSVENPRG